MARRRFRFQWMRMSAAERRRVFDALLFPVPRTEFESERDQSDAQQTRRGRSDSVVASEPGARSAFVRVENLAGMEGEKLRRYVTGVGWCWMQDGEVIEVIARDGEAVSVGRRV